ncbi:MAG: hypothetical protein Hyperionvirus19_17 [Hyperionvirus sp.]|uniref:Uncharacterized protein n=1 Tax=Hyperionvirus sp. TaxID=2487770 RepID=A0A3G5AE85_9VIRU|nr:MAG: hypothetical protein Hyperionvirus19_17 [Hyperionvirus sp.]
MSNTVLETDSHETVVLDFFGNEVEIDKKISQLIQELWKADIITRLSSEDNVPEGYVWIQFDTLVDFAKFMDVIFLGEDYKNDVFKRSISDFCYPGKKWKFRVNISGEDDYMDDNDDGGFENAKNIVKNIRLNPSVRFPHEDQPYVYEKIKKFNAREFNQVLAKYIKDCDEP